MKAFLYSLTLQWKIDLRNKAVLIVYYIVPLIFFLFIGGVFTSINPLSKETLIQSMAVFSVTMGAVLGTPIALNELYGSEIKKSYKVGNIPMWLAVVNNFISAFIHLFVVSMIIFLLAPIVFSATIPQNLLLYFVGLICLLLASISIGTILGLLVKSIPKLTMIGQVIFLPSLMLSGIMFPSSMLPPIAAKIGYISPATMGFNVMTSKAFAVFPTLILLAVFVVLLATSIILVKRKQF